MANLFDKLSSALQTPLSGFGISGVGQVSARIAANLKSPIGSASTMGNVTRIYGSENEFLKQYQNFNNLYKRALSKELDSTAISAGQRRMIQAAMEAPVINLNLIRNVKERQNLVSMLRNNVLDIESMVKNFGAPGLGLPSSNLYRTAARYLVDQKSGSNHPVLSLINSLTFNIDKTKAGAQAFDVGKSNLPSFSALQNAFEQSKSITSGGGIFSRLSPTSPVKVLTFDVETSGLGIYDQVRSLAASSMEIQHGGVVRHQADGFSTHFITPQMEQYTMGGQSGAKTRLGTGVYNVEKQPGDFVADLTTEQGRREAAKQYKKFFQQAVEADYVAGHNVQFDIQRINMSVSGLDEFFQDQEAVDVYKRFQKMAEEGRVVNTLDVARDYLTRQALEIAEAQGPDEILRTQKLISTMFAPETLARASIGGAATPFSVSNIASQTNLLALIETEGGTEGARLVRDLATTGSGAHVAKSDTILTNYMMQFIQTGKLKYGFEAMSGPASEVSLARKQMLKASAIVPTTNIADVRHMSDAVFRFAISEKGIQATKLTTDKGIISFSKADNQFYEHATDPITGQVTSNKLTDQTLAKQRVVDAIMASRSNQQSELLETGINYLQASRVDSILENVARTSSLTTATSPDSLIAAISGGSDIAAEERFIDALAGTREFLGFNQYDYRPEILAEKGMPNLMSRSYGMISDTARENYLTKLASAGISTAVDDPYMRRNFVELATITSSMPYVQKSEGYTGGLAGRLVRQIAAKNIGSGPITEAEHAERVSKFNSNVGVRVGEYLSEIGVSFADAQTTNYLIGKEGRISRPVVSGDILKNIQVTIADKTGATKQVGFLSQEFLSSYGHNKFGLSVTQRNEERMVNLVFGNLAADTNSGQRVVSRSMSRELANGIIEQMRTLTDGKTTKQLVEQGVFEAEAHAISFMNRLREATSDQTKGSTRKMATLRNELARSISERGIAVASIAGREAEGVAALLEQIAGGIDNDTEAFRKGMQFAISEYGDDFVAFQGRIDEKVIEALRATNPQLAGQIEGGDLLRRAYETYNATMQRAGEDVTFAKRLQRAFSSKGLDKGIFGTRIGRNLRDARVREVYKKVAPKVGIGALAVGALSAGYYIAKKNRKNDLYNQVMEEQPYEERGAVSSNNENLRQEYPQNSTRRDPLVTAGVVGNLDRNKIGHTQMGPNKYNHLYG